MLSVLFRQDPASFRITSVNSDCLGNIVWANKLSITCKVYPVMIISDVTFFVVFAVLLGVNDDIVFCTLQVNWKVAFPSQGIYRKILWI